MKILMLGWELPPYNTGGLGVACFNLCKALSRGGVSIDFVVPYQDYHEQIDFMNVLPALAYSATQLQLAGSAYTSQWWHWNIGNDPEAGPLTGGLRAQQAHYIRAVQTLPGLKYYDAIHAHDWLTFEAGMAAKRMTNKPLIAHVHATEFDRAGSNSGNPLVHEIEYAALCMADRIIAVSQATKDVIATNYAIPFDKIDVVHNSINPRELPALDPENAYVYLQAMKSFGYSVVANVGRLTIQKGLVHLLRAARLAIDQHPKLLFLLAGNGEQYYELIELSANLGISQNIVFTGGFVRGKAWRDAYAVADMFVLPSVSEPFGITALEAIGYGAPALISKQSGVGEVLRSVLRFDFWDEQRLANQIVAVAEHRSLHDELNHGAWEELQNLSWQTVAKKCEAVYQNTLAASGAGL
jgi:glycogen synthase